ncbi:MAG: response regulator [Saprospiraceae bacterium]|nr:response regulator [Candidatus Opimibacter skivensis]MBP6680812.1 response regulator [Saprospiraceae bacterium]
MENEPLHILLADDDEGDRLLFTEAFSELNFKTVVDTVNNGVQLMEWLRMKNIRLPHFIFLDLNMPRKGGLECLKEIKSDDKLKDISVAIYSTSDSEKDKEEAFRHGANVYIAKPNNFTKLKQVLEKAVMTA